VTDEELLKAEREQVLRGAWESILADDPGEPWPGSSEAIKSATEGMKRRRARERTHRCYELAFDFVSDNDGAVLVHGRIHESTAHAWVELADGAIVYDAVRDRLYPAAVYQEHLEAHAFVRYSRQEAAALAVSTGSSGAWDKRSYWPAFAHLPDWEQRVEEAVARYKQQAPEHGLGSG
jgi:hypothetical protein